MKFSIKTLLLLLAVSAVSMTACKKDDEKSAEDKLSGSSCWKLTKDEYFDPSTSIWTVEPIDDCSKDDCVTFKADKSYTFDEGTTKCDPTDPQTLTGTWSISADGKSLTVNEGGDISVGTIIELTDSKLVLEVDLGIFGKFRSTLTN